MRAVRWLALSVLTLAPAAWADDRPEIIVTAPLEGSRIESLQGATTLDRQALINNLTGGLGETLSHTPGVSSTFYGAGASRPIIRGLGDDRVRVLQNGIGAIDASSASPDHAATADGIDAERVEVLRGAAALAYGGNAIGGVVNVLDQSIPTRAPEKAFGGEVLLGLSTVDEGAQGALGLTGAVGDFVVRLEAAKREGEDYDVPGFVRSAAARAADPIPDEVKDTAPNSFANYDAYSLGVSRLFDTGFVGVAVKRTETEYGLPVEAGETEGGRIELEQTRYETRGDWTLDLGVFTRFDYALQYADYEHKELEPDGEVGTTFANEGFEARVEAHTSLLGDNLKGAVGLQLTDTDFSAVGEEAFITPTTTRDWGLFTVQRYDRGGWGLEGGLRVETRDHENAAFGDRDFTAVSGSIGAFARPADNWFAGATLARTERAPTAIELFADGPHAATQAFEIGDPNVDKEKALSLEGSLRRTGEAVSLELSVYRAEFDDFIAFTPTGAIEDDLPVFQVVQRDATFTGGEIFGSARLARFGGFTLRGDAALDYVRAEFDGAGDVPRIPPRSLTVGLNAETSLFNARVEAVDVAKQDDVATFETPTDGYTWVNARVALTPFADRDLRLLLDVRNITDEEARVHTSFLKDVLPRPGRSFRIALTTSF